MAAVVFVDGNNNGEGRCGQGYIDAGKGLSRTQKVLIKIYCIEKCLLDLDPIKFYAYQLIFIVTLVLMHNS
jgi:hypothetical protein